jgi:recombination protein U
LFSKRSYLIDIGRYSLNTRYEGEDMPSWNSRGLRGSLLETLINMTNDKYREQGLALVQKVPTPITPVNINDKGQITLAYFDSKSTVDYIGVVQGIPVCFDAKECNKATFPLQNIHEHQVKFMEDFEAQDGVAFMVIYFSDTDEYYYAPFKEIKKYWDRAVHGGRKSIKREEFFEGYYLDVTGKTTVPYLEGLEKDLESRDDQ